MDTWLQSPIVRSFLWAEVSLAWIRSIPNGLVNLCYYSWRYKLFTPALNSAGVLISTLPDPTSFNNFSQVNSFFQVQGEGAFCIPLDFSKSNVTSLSTGQNVTIQVSFPLLGYCYGLIEAVNNLPDCLRWWWWSTIPSELSLQLNIYMIDIPDLSIAF